MTDQELQELISKRDEVIIKREKAYDAFNKETYKYDQEEAKLTEKIKQEELDRLMAEEKDQWVENVKSFFNKWYCTNNNKVTEQLWMVEVNGKKLRSGTKGKYTWTSENRAFRGICDYIYYHNYDIQHAVNQDKLDLGAVVEELIDEGYIKITQVV